MAFDPTRTPGSFTPPPSNAPREVTDGTVPGDVTIVMPDGSTTSAARMARQYEQELPVYAPKPMTVEQMAAYLGKSVVEIEALQASVSLPEETATKIAPTKPVVDITQSNVIVTQNDVTPTKAVVLVDPNGSPVSSQPVGNPRSLRHARPAITATPVEAIETAAADDAVPPAVTHSAAASELQPQQPSSLADAARAVHARTIPTDEPYRPAASNTDSPSRGIPTPAADLNKQITGGFGDGGEAQYYPLDGLELRKVVELLLDKQRQRIQDDLRFSLALTYPRVRVRSVIEVECFAEDGSFSITNIAPPHEKTPIEIARRHGDEVCFCLVEQRQEFDDENQSESPPNAMRLEVGVPVPRKHAVSVAGGRGRLLVDVDS